MGAVAATPAFEVVAEIPVRGDRAHVYPEGWQSWSPTDWYPISGSQPRPQEPWQHAMRFRPGVGLPQKGFQAEGILAVDPGNGSPVCGFVASSPDEVPSLRVRLVGEVAVVSSNGPVAELTGSSRADVLTRIGEALATGTVRPAPTVWCSWYHYFGGVTEADIVENLHALERFDLPSEVVQIDDGWQSAVGDWTSLSGRFRDMRAVAARVAERGRRAGIWLAPFTAVASSELVRRHPDWVVGYAGECWGEDIFGLDLSHPDVLDHLGEVFTDLREDGYDYVKLDFLHSGAIPGRRHQDMSALQAYRLGMTRIREALGPDVFVVGCGAPLLPSLGLVDGMRVSADTFHEGAQDGSAGLRGEAACVARSWQHGRLWNNDGDAFVARPAFALRESWARVLSGHSGMRTHSDRIAELDDWGLAATREFLTTAPGAGPIVPSQRGGHIR